ncbi:glycosyltransferase family 2 protein [Paludibacterium yongneupense]|uniref:glycosyltransferase family 2 protein n=1 Tax=Paludibacterium yongneupense TaxID=400061 RepID=UPI0003F7128E|nr:glycosyltransferase [Paludibacterium yongneupense]
MSDSNAPHTGAGISCVICAYNEAPRIGAVLRVVAVHPLLDEVIVVDDGSLDATADVVRRFPSVRLLSLPTNHGKSAAMAAGIAAARHGLLMLLDADLKGLTHEHVSALAAPVLAGDSDLSLSLRQNSLPIFRAIGLDFVSGERVIRKELLSDTLLQIHDLPRFGIEVFMNRQIIARQLSIAVTRWKRVTQSRKTEKLGYWKGTCAEWRMIVDLLHVAKPPELIAQNWHLLMLKIGRKRRRSGRVTAPARFFAWHRRVRAARRAARQAGRPEAR